MRAISLLLILPVGALTALAVVSCGSGSSTSKFGNGNGDDDATTDDAGDDAGDDGPCLACSDAETGPQCVNLECRQAACHTTSISGTVYDPAGKLPLYNVFVYVPNAPTDPIKPGNVPCSQCQAPASGSPLVSATTDAHGKFTIKNAPGGPNIPLVMQVGKWRRQITIPNVTDCVDNPQTDVNKMRLPAKKSEGDMPQIAFTSGCDVAECFLRHVGIDDSEFTGPSGNGRVHFYMGSGGSNVNGGVTTSQTYQWWSDHKNLLKYDIVFNACECAPYDRNGNGGGSPESAYSAMHAYLEGGGRVFATHYYYNWFAPSTGPSDFQSVIQWMPESAPYYPSYFIDSSFPKGKSFADWLQNNGVTQTYGQITLSDTREDMGAIVQGKATRWIYSATAANSPQYSSMYVSFNTPVNKPVNQQCGRAVFSDVHLSGSGYGTYPQECANPDQAHAIQEKALEFLFFDLSSCVQDDSKPPPPPPPK